MTEDEHYYSSSSESPGLSVNVIDRVEESEADVLIEETAVASSMPKEQLVVKTTTDPNTIGLDSYYVVDHLISTHVRDTHHHVFFPDDCFLFEFDTKDHDFIPFEIIDTCLDDSVC